jgi:hypothetical protein
MQICGFGYPNNNNLLANTKRAPKNVKGASGWWEIKSYHKISDLNLRKTLGNLGGKS